MKLLHEDLTNEILGSFYEVYNKLGFGFLERVYENSLALLLRERGIDVQQQAPISVYFHGVLVGEYYADILVNDLVIVELKAAETLRQEHLAQLRNYLRATDVEVGLLLNFGHNATFKRVFLTNDRKDPHHIVPHP
jgi:GxxExxY protein